MSGARPVRLLVVDDHPVVRSGLVGMVDAHPDVEVVGEAGDGEEAVRLARTLAPDVVLMDLRMPGTSGAEATRRIRASGEDAPHVLVLTTFDSDRDIMAALDAGATGYLLKDASPDDVTRAVRAAAVGRSVLSPVVASRLLSRVRDDRDAPLTEREVSVLQHVAAGASNREVARALFVSEATVKAHLSRVFDKLGVADRAAAVAVGYERGILGG